MDAGGGTKIILGAAENALVSIYKYKISCERFKVKPVNVTDEAIGQLKDFIKRLKGEINEG